MTKEIFRKHIIISSILTIIAVAVITGFCIIMFHKYAMPNENNTSVISGTVTDVCHKFPKGEVVLDVSNGESLRLVYPWGIHNLYSTIGYDIDELVDLLEGNIIECRRMNRVPWALEIYIGDIKIDNSKLTIDKIVSTQASIVILGLLMLAFLINGDIIYLKQKYKCYIKAKKKQERKAKRKLKSSK